MIDRTTCGMVLFASLISQWSRRVHAQKQARARACVCVCASVRVVLHAGENAHLREPETEPSCILLYAPFRGLSVTQRGESLHVALQCSNRKLDVSVRAQWLRRNWLKYPLKVTVHANVCPWGFWVFWFFLSHLNLRMSVCKRERESVPIFWISWYFFDMMCSAHLSLHRCTLCCPWTDASQ